MQLRKPNIKFQTQYIEMLAEWKESQEKLIPFPLKYDTSDFPAFLTKMSLAEQQPEEGFVLHSTFWLFDNNDKLVGVSNLRHRLNENLLVIGGHIGYGIRPSERRKGHATTILNLTLLEAKQIGIYKVLVTCDKDNIASAKTILRNGGELWKEHIIDGVVKQNYWINNQ